MLSLNVLHVVLLLCCMYWVPIIHYIVLLSKFFCVLVFGAADYCFERRGAKQKFAL